LCYRRVCGPGLATGSRSAKRIPGWRGSPFSFRPSAVESAGASGCQADSPVWREARIGSQAVRAFDSQRTSHSRALRAATKLKLRSWIQPAQLPTRPSSPHLGLKRPILACRETARPFSNQAGSKPNGPGKPSPKRLQPAPWLAVHLPAGRQPSGSLDGKGPDEGQVGGIGR